MSLGRVLDEMRADPRLMNCVTAWHRLPAKPGCYADFPSALHPRLIEALGRRGIERLYSHQASAVDAVLSGQNVVVVTPTASGKTLCYNLPVLNAMVRTPTARALYLFPTKALAQDQLAELHRMIEALATRIRAYTYDGDTPAPARRSIRASGQIIVTNPDMLHTGILPHHTKWLHLFSELKYVVIDEVHGYRGVFGSHLTNVIRRLKRVCRFYGSRPQFICCSATIANPAELAERLIEEEVVLIDNDGSPKGKKHFIFYNPPLVDRELGIRRSAILEARGLVNRFLESDVQTIVFTRARLTTEVLLTYLQDDAGDRGRKQLSVRGYRGGYLPRERREIERGLREGKVRGVVATNALELGVDIGELSACVMTGYPGTIASAWQQAGRAGRRAETSTAMLVATAGPLDQYVVTHPDYFFEQSPEHGLINPDNLIILLNHIKCAAFELPFAEGEGFGNLTPQATAEVLNFLAEEEVLYHSGGTWYWMSETYPAEDISLRTVAPDNFVIVDRTAESRVIGQVDRQSAIWLIHPEAIYLHQGQQYHVDELDWEGRWAYVRRVAVGYYTEAQLTVEISVLDVTAQEREGGALKAHGQVMVTTKATGFNKIKLYTHENLGQGEIDLPEQEMQTTAYWLSLPQETVDRLRDEGLWRGDTIDYGPDWLGQRRRTRQRDRFTCQRCGAVETDREHDVHHLVPFRQFGYVPGKNEKYKEANALTNLVTLCHTCHGQAELSRRTRSGLAGLANLLGTVAPLYLMCDPRDIGLATEPRSRFTGQPTIFIYDKVPAGVGFSQALYGLHAELLKRAEELIQDCPCTSGCPSCVGPASEIGDGGKEHTRALIRACSAKDEDGVVHEQT
ncbi:MAG: DEAD/DEAH box helicase [Anaerolineae bacterium]